MSVSVCDILICMKTYIIGFFTTILSILILDAVWLSLTMKTFYAKHLGHLFADKPSLTPAVLFYILYSVGLLYFVIMPVIRSGASLSSIFVTGAFFGLIAYATYDLTNQATMKDWVTAVTVVDLVWGSFLTGTVSTVAVWVIRLLKLI